jgi:predicted nucleic acid-binding protein
MLDDSERGKKTKDFFEHILRYNHQLVLSEVVKGEIDDAEQHKKLVILRFLNTLPALYLPYSLDAHHLAAKYLEEGILTNNHIDDLLHIAYATVYRCDIIISWNRKHIAKQSKIKQINACNLKNNYRVIEIYTPDEFLTLFEQK